LNFFCVDVCGERYSSRIKRLIGVFTDTQRFSVATSSCKTPPCIALSGHSTITSLFWKTNFSTFVQDELIDHKKGIKFYQTQTSEASSDGNATVTTKAWSKSSLSVTQPFDLLEGEAAEENGALNHFALSCLWKFRDRRRSGSRLTTFGCGGCAAAAALEVCIALSSWTLRQIQYFALLHTFLEVSSLTWNLTMISKEDTMLSSSESRLRSAAKPLPGSWRAATRKSVLATLHEGAKTEHSQVCLSLSLNF
jgi:hypothetical protein